MVEITRTAIDVHRLIALVTTPQSGAVDVFIGTTRNHSHGREVVTLEYEAYEPMAVRELEILEAKAFNRWSLHRIAIVHRIGRVEIGEASVAIAVSSAHRKEAFEACRFLIDELKKSVPIWKREYFADGSTEWAGSISELQRTSHRTAP
jgi:molybdopterin synthase catalytic subunit